MGDTDELRVPEVDRCVQGAVKDEIFTGAAVMASVPAAAPTVRSRRGARLRAPRVCRHYAWHMAASQAAGSHDPLRSPGWLWWW